MNPLILQNKNYYIWKKKKKNAKLMEHAANGNSAW